MSLVITFAKVGLATLLCSRVLLCSSSLGKMLLAQFTSNVSHSNFHFVITVACVHFTVTGLYSMVQATNCSINCHVPDPFPQCRMGSGCVKLSSVLHMTEAHNEKEHLT